ncbi:solute carrier organic anion transporter family member 3A1-like isoform X2 [Branchiostoma lanceolatum]|uniref:solute carrier organic anion transporter family member 3A1-like isoform X2 n=1 Tax=Branchiostoma lanceolatum TaxID=7740 RepID=UPI003456AC38
MTLHISVINKELQCCSVTPSCEAGHQTVRASEKPFNRNIQNVCDVIRYANQPDEQVELWGSVSISRDSSVGKPRKADTSRLAADMANGNANGSGPPSSHHPGIKVEDEEIQCGVGPCKPRWAARLANSKVFVASWCIAIFSNILISAYLLGILTSLEKRFGLQSKDLGTIASAADIGSTLTVLFVTYYGGRMGVNRPRLIGIGVLCVAVGSFLSGMPHFVTPAYEVDTESVQNATQMKSLDVCLANQTMDDRCNANEATASSNKGGWYALLVFAQIIMGVGSTPIMALGTTYIDDHVMKSSAPLYIGTSYIVFGLGPPLGFILSAYTVQFYVDFDKNIDPRTFGLSQDNPLWVGAWWLGYFLGGALLIFAALPLFFFPYKLEAPPEEDETQVLNAKKKSFMPGMGMDSGRKPLLDPARGLLEQIKEMVKSLKTILTNWTFILLALTAVCAVSTIGAFSFMPKYLEMQFGIPKSKANFLLGMISLPSSVFGILGSGIVIKKLKLSPKGCMYLSALSIITSSCCTVPLMFINCPQSPMAGVTVPYGYNPNNPSEATTLQGIGLISSCNSACNCPLDKYKPVCGPDGVTYFSGCHAGCTEEQIIRGPGKFSFSNFSNCGCMWTRTPGMPGAGGYVATAIPGRQKRDANDSTTTASNPATTPDNIASTAYPSQATDAMEDETNGGAQNFAISKPCRPPCDKWPVFVGIYFVAALSRSFGFIPVIIGTLRALTPETKSFGFGVQQLMLRLLGFIPSPVYFGAMIDSTCTLWSSMCGKRGACLLYDLAMNRYVFIGGQLVLRLLSLTLVLCAAYRFKKQEEREAGEAKKDGATLGELAVSMGSLTASHHSLRASRHSLASSRHSLDVIADTNKPMIPRDTEDMRAGLWKKHGDSQI